MNASPSWNVYRVDKNMEMIHPHKLISEDILHKDQKTILYISKAEVFVSALENSIYLCLMEWAWKKEE